MDFQDFVDAFSGSCFVVSVQKTANGRCGEVRIVTANKTYKQNLGDTLFHDNILYTELIPKDPKFEDFCYRSAILHQKMHAYVELHTMDCWVDNTYIPLVSDSESLGYCAVLLEVTPKVDAEKMSDVSLETASSVIKTCVNLRGTEDFKASMNSVITEIQEKTDSYSSVILLLNKKTRTFSVLCEKFRNDVASVEDYRDVLSYDIVSSWIPTIGSSNGIIVKDEEDMKSLEARNPEWGASLRSAEVESVILFPLLQGSEAIGFLYVTNFDTTRVVEIKELIELTAFFLSAEIVNHRLLEELEYMSTVDYLTGVKNRNAMNRRVDLFVSGEELVKAPFGVLFADLNGLKQRNDASGHAAGDELLKGAAELLKQIFAEDEIYRAGGDEFVVICPACEEAEFMNKIAEVRAKSCYGAKVCLAIGAHWNKDGKNLRLSMHLADEEMYKDKENFYIAHADKKRRR